jgi:hypothetical protein
MTSEHGHAPVETHNAWAGRGAAVLDIGGDVGALAVAMPAAWVGREVEIRPLGRHDHGHAHLAHVAVVNRPVAGGRVPSLVFGELAAGHYELFEKGRPDAVAVRATVVGGEVTCTVWPDGPV